MSDPMLTTGDWQAAMAEAMAPRPGDESGKTTAELAEICGIPESRVKTNLRQMMRSGRLACVRKRVVAIDGTWRPVPAYKLKDAPKGKERVK